MSEKTETTTVKDTICAEIVRIANTCDEQEDRGYIDTPGGLENMSDVWWLFRSWRTTILKEEAMKVGR